MANRRRFLIRVGAVGSSITVAGCVEINLGDGGGDTDTGQDEQTERDEETEEPDERTDEQEFDIQLVPAWEHDIGFNVTTAAGDFFTGFTEVTRISPTGDVVFETEEFENDYRSIIRSGWRNAVYADDAGVYVGATPDDDSQGGRMYVLEPDTGNQRWMFEEPADGLHNNIRATTRVDDLVVYASMSSGSGSDQDPIVRAVDATTGVEQWEISYSEGFVTGIFATEDRLFVQQVFGLFVYDLATQEKIKEVDVSSGFNRAIHDDGTLYMPGETIRALSLPSTDEQWSVDTGYDVNTAATLTETALFVGTEAGFILAYDRETGDQLWETRVDGVVGHPPVVEDGVVWIANERGELSAYTTQTGDLIYQEHVEPGFDFAVQDGVLVDSERETAFEIRRT